tara:strand:+ start:156 stop:3623 length:3468 start_codon:yes stop_codon:yes gene_type:complete
MAKTLSKSNIVTNNTILASDVSQSIDAFAGTEAYDITVSGSLTTTGSVDISGLLTATAGISHQLTASNAVSASFAASVPASGLPTGVISSSAQISTEISGAFDAPSASFSTRVTANEAASASFSTRVTANEVVTAKTLVSSSTQLATEISGAFTSTSASLAADLTTNTTNLSILTLKTGSYARTGSNSFVDSQRFTGSLEVSQSKVVFNTSGSTSRNVFILDDDLAFNNNNITDGSNDQRGNLVVAYESASRYKGIAVINAVTSSDVDALNYVRIGHIESGSGDHFSSQLAFTEQPVISLISEGDVMGMTVSGSYGDSGHVNTGVIYFGDDGTDRMIIGSKRGSEILFNPIMVFSQAVTNGTGSVGIGIANSNPSAKLHVSLSADIGTALKVEGLVDLTNTTAISGSTFSGSFVGDGSGLTDVFEGTSTSASISTRITANEASISTNTTNITSLELATGSYATTASNAFNGNQTITGSLKVSGSRALFEVSGSTSKNVFILDDGLEFNNTNLTDASNDQRGNLVVAYESGSRYKGIAVINAVTSSDNSALNYVRIGHIESGSGDHFSSQLAFTEQPVISLNSEGDVMGMTVSGSYGDSGHVNTGVIYFGDDGTDRMIIGSKRGSEIVFNPIMVFSQAVTNGTGSVGIGIDNSNPSAKLHVSLSSDIGTAFKAEGIATFEGNITASGDISASGVVYGETGSFSHLQGNSPFTIGDIVTFQQAVSSSGGLYATASAGYTGALLDVNGHLMVEHTGAITGSGGVYITASAGQSTALLDVGGHLQVQNTGAITGSGGLYVTASAGQSTALLDVNGHLMVEHSGIVDMTGAGAISGSTFSGSFVGNGSGLTEVFEGTATSASISTRITANEVVTAKTLVSSSTQLATEISGAFAATSASLSADLTTNTTNITSLTLETGSYAITGSNVTFANITASGNISSSGDISINTGSFGEISVSRNIRHTGDADTRIEFLDNKLQLHAGNLPFITLDKDSSSPYPLTVNNGGNRINFKVVDENSDLLLKTDSELSRVNLYHAGNRKLETSAEGINITGSLTLSGSLYFTSNVIKTVENGTTALDGSESLVMIDASSGNVTINLPLAASFPAKQINFKVIADPGSYTMTLQRQGSDTIDGATSNTSLDTQWEALSVISDGSSQWLIF